MSHGSPQRRPGAWLRSLLREPRTALPALLLLALGVGGFAWMLALGRSLMLRSLPAPRPDRLVSLYGYLGPEPGQHGTPSTAELQLMRGFPDVFKGVAAWEPTNANLGLDQPVRVRLDRVTGNFFDVLGVQPALGRGFQGADDEAGAPPTAVLAHGAWRDRFGGDPGVIGRIIHLNGESVQVLGVLPEGFHTPHGTDVFRPFQWTAQARDDHGPHFLRVFARLQEGANLGQGKAAMDQVADRIRARFKGEAPQDLLDQLHFGAMPLVDELLGQGLRVLRVLRLATLVVLLLAAYNAASLLVARGLGRRTEMAVRSALGALPADLRKLALWEGALMGGAGAVGGLLLAQGSLGPTGRVLGWAFPDLGPTLLALDLPTVLAALVLGPLLGAGCALASQPGKHMGDLLRLGARLPNLAAVGLTRRLLVGAQLVIGGALLIGSLSLAHGLGRMLSTDLGFDRDGVWCFQLQPGGRIPLAARTELARTLVERLSSLPGVRAAGAGNGLPMSGFRSDLNLSLPDGRTLDPEARALSPGMVKALGLRLLRGRDLEATDRADSAKVVLVTRALALQAFGTVEAVGRPLVLQEAPYTVVGVLDDVREFGPAQAAPPMFYLPLAQSDVVWNRELAVAFRAAVPPSEAQLRAVLREVAPGLALHRYVPMAALLKTQLGPQRMALAFLGAFSALALLLAVGGVFGIMTASVAMRRAEFGVRSALGATPWTLLGQVLRETFRLAAVAGTCGALLGTLLERLSRGVLGAWPDPPLMLPLLALAALVGAALAAAFLPALRAARVSPAEALREG